MVEGAGQARAQQVENRINTLTTQVGTPLDTPGGDASHVEDSSMYNVSSQVHEQDPMKPGKARPACARPKAGLHRLASSAPLPERQLCFQLICLFLYSCFLIFL